MIGIQDLTDIIRLNLFSGHIKDEVPASTLIVAEVELGKSELTKRFADNKGVVFPHDITAYGIVKAYGKRLVPSHPDRIRHLIFPEFIHCLERQKETVKTLLAFLNGLVAEGVQEIHTYKTNFRLPEPMQAGVIACLTTGEFEDWKGYWQRSGFLSRFLPVTYSYSRRVEDQIFNSIFSREYRKDPPIYLRFPKQPVDVKLSRKLASELKPTVKKIALSIYNALQPKQAQQQSPIRRLRGFRGQTLLQRLAMASAIEQGRDYVTPSDIERIRRLAEKYMNFDYTEI